MIPKIIHQMAPKDKDLWHPVWEKCHKIWKIKFPENEYRHIMWDQETIENFIFIEFPQYFEFYNFLPFHIMQIDFAKFCILYKFGGIYADMDMYCIENFYNDLVKNISIVESSSSIELLQNSLICCEKHNIHLSRIIERCKEKFNNINKFYYTDKDEFVSLFTGPLFVSNYYESLTEDEQNEIQILSKDTYNPSILSININNLLEKKVIHFLTGIWGKETYGEIINRKNELNNQNSLKNFMFDQWKEFRFLHKNIFLHLFGDERYS